MILWPSGPYQFSVQSSNKLYTGQENDKGLWARIASNVWNGHRKMEFRPRIRIPQDIWKRRFERLIILSSRSTQQNHKNGNNIIAFGRDLSPVTSKIMYFYVLYFFFMPAQYKNLVIFHPEMHKLKLPRANVIIGFKMFAWSACALKRSKDISHNFAVHE